MQKEKTKEFIPLYRDLMFKNLFGTEENKRFTIDMLEKFFKLEKDSLKTAKIINSVKLDNETIINKRFELDIIVELENNEIINIEMQKVYDKNAEIKNFMYLTKLFSTEMNFGEKYKNVRQGTGLNFVKEMRLHKDNKRVIQRYVMTNEENPKDKLLPDLFSLTIIDIDPNCEIFYNEINEAFNNWRRFIGCETEEELREISETDPILKEAYKECMRFMYNEYAQDYSLQEKLIRSQLDSFKEEGIEEGRLEEKHSIAKEMLKHNKPIEEIMTYTNLTKETLEKLKEEIKEN